VTETSPLIQTLTESVNNLKTIVQLKHSHFFLEKLTLYKNQIRVEKSDLFECITTGWMTDNYKKKIKKKQRLKEVLLYSIENLKKHYRVIQKTLSSEDPHDQAWAKMTLDTINDYNALLIHLRTENKKPFYRLKRVSANFFSPTFFGDELLTVLVEIPSMYLLRFETTHEQATSEEKAMEKIAQSLKGGETVELSVNERDVFHMRAITLASKSNLPSDLAKDITKLLKETPIRASKTDKKEEESDSIISMVQMLTPFPGEEITVSGRIKRKEDRPVPSVPDPKSFRVSTIVSQTGFPHPSQYSGWALTACFTPQSLLRLDLTPEYHAIHQIKQQIAHDLLPNNRLNIKAKTLLKLKKRAFEQNAEVYLRLHRQLSLAMLRSAPYEGLSEEIIVERVDPFYDRVENHPSPFDYLSQAHHLINKTFIDHLYEKLLHEWQDEENPGLFSNNRRERFKTAFDILHDELSLAVDEFTRNAERPHSELDLATLRFTLIQGQVLGEVAIKILLLYFSEKIGFAPPLLNHFEISTQAAAFRQILFFQNELESPLSENEEEALPLLQKRYQKALKNDVELFESCELKEPIEASICHELERYYNSRYTLLSKIHKRKS